MSDKDTIRELKRSLAFYAERRNYQHAAPGTMHDLATCPIALADTFDDDDGPGSRARAALSKAGPAAVEQDAVESVPF